MPQRERDWFEFQNAYPYYFVWKLSTDYLTYFYPILFETLHQKTNNLEFRSGPTQTGLYSHSSLYSRVFRLLDFKTSCKRQTKIIMIENAMHDTLEQRKSFGVFCSFAFNGFQMPGLNIQLLLKSSTVRSRLSPKV